MFDDDTPPWETADNEPVNPTHGWAMALLGIALLALCGYWLVACGAPPEPAAEATTTVTVPPSPMPTEPATTTLPELNLDGVLAATASRQVERVAPPSTLAPFDCVAYINNLPWEWTNREVGNDAYTVGARCRGWDEATIDKWRPFVVDDVWAKESGWCWNLLRGDVVIVNLGCVLNTDGVRHEDAGIGQATSSYWGPNGYLCVNLGYCSKWSIIASPYDSVMAALGVIEGGGNSGYCYNEKARRYHQGCKATTAAWP